MNQVMYTSCYQTPQGIIRETFYHVTEISKTKTHSSAKLLRPPFYLNTAPKLVGAVVAAYIFMSLSKQERIMFFKHFFAIFPYSIKKLTISSSSWCQTTQDTCPYYFMTLIHEIEA